MNLTGEEMKGVRGTVKREKKRVSSAGFPFPCCYAMLQQSLKTVDTEQQLAKTVEEVEGKRRRESRGGCWLCKVREV